MDYSKWKKISIILLIISLLINIFSKVFASEQTIELAYYSSSSNRYNLTIDPQIDFCKLNNTFIDDSVWNYEHIAFSNYSDSAGYYYLFTIVWNGDLRVGVGASPGNPTVSGIYCTGTYAFRNYSYAFRGNSYVSTFNKPVNEWEQGSANSGVFGYTGAQNINNYVYSSGNIYDKDNDVIYESDYIPFNAPHFDTPDSELNNLTFDYLFVDPADYGIDDPLYLHTLQITQTVTDNTSTIYYYTDNLFMLEDSSEYFRQFLDSDLYYYAIPRRKLGFQVDSVYLLVLSNSPDVITNSVGPIVVDVDNGIYEAVSINTTDIYSYQQVIDDNIQNIQDDLTNTDSNISDDDILDNFDYDTENSQLSNNHTGFFSRLLNLFTNLYDYDLNSDSPIQIPMPNSNKKIVLHSNIISSNIGEPLKSIIGAFWLYIFYLFAWKFFNYIYIEIQSGKILDDENSSVPRCYSYGYFIGGYYV